MQDFLDPENKRRFYNSEMALLISQLRGRSSRVSKILKFDRLLTSHILMEVCGYSLK